MKMTQLYLLFERTEAVDEFGKKRAFDVSNERKKKKKQHMQ